MRSYALKVTPDEVYEYIRFLIERSPEKEVEIPISEMAQHFGVSPSTIDIRVNDLLEKEAFSVAPHRGLRNRRIFRMPDSRQAKVFNPMNQSPDMIDRLKGAIPSSLRADPPNVPEADLNDPPAPKEDHNMPSEPAVVNPETKKFYEEFEQREQTLDDQIKDFQSRVQASSAELILEREDREILSVATDSITQFGIFLRDILDQLSTVHDKRLIQGLIDDRNDRMNEIESLKQQNLILTTQLKETKDSLGVRHDIENRGRAHIQQIIYMMDKFFEQPAQTIYLDRAKFKKELSSEMMMLFRILMGQEN